MSYKIEATQLGRTQAKLQIAAKNLREAAKFIREHGDAFDEPLAQHYELCAYTMDSCCRELERLEWVSSIRERSLLAKV